MIIHRNNGHLTSMILTDHQDMAKHIDTIRMREHTAKRTRMIHTREHTAVHTDMTLMREHMAKHIRMTHTRERTAKRTRCTKTMMISILMMMVKIIVHRSNG